MQRGGGGDFLCYNFDLPICSGNGCIQGTKDRSPGLCLPLYAQIGRCLHQIHQEGPTVVLDSPVWPSSCLLRCWPTPQSCQYTRISCKNLSTETTLYS